MLRVSNACIIANSSDLCLSFDQTTPIGSLTEACKQGKIQHESTGSSLLDGARLSVSAEAPRRPRGEGRVGPRSSARPGGQWSAADDDGPAEAQLREAATPTTGAGEAGGSRKMEKGALIENRYALIENRYVRRDHVVAGGHRGIRASAARGGRSLHTSDLEGRRRWVVCSCGLRRKQGKCHRGGNHDGGYVERWVKKIAMGEGVRYF